LLYRFGWRTPVSCPWSVIILIHVQVSGISQARDGFKPLLYFYSIDAVFLFLAFDETTGLLPRWHGASKMSIKNKVLRIGKQHKLEALMWYGQLQ
jgi:hypothetical protein